MRKLICGVMALAVMLTLVGTVKAAGLVDKLNISGDVVYDIREGGLGVGSGIDIAKWKDELIIARVEASRVNEKTKVGAGLGLDIVKGLKALGATGISENIKSSLCLLGAVDISDTQINRDDFSAQIVLTVMKWEW